MSRFGDRAAKKLAAGFLGRIIRHAVRDHHYIFPSNGTQAVTIGPGAVLNDALLNVSSGTITIGHDALLAHGVAILTGTHDYRVFGVDRRHAIPREGRDIVIGEGVWIASNATVLGPCRIGEHAVVAAGSVVIADVPPYSVVAGVPARTVAEIPRPQSGTGSGARDEEEAAS